MSNRAVISTPAAPEAIGPYSQAIKVGNTVWLSGQIPLIPGSMELVTGDITDQATQVFKNLAAVAEAAGGNMNSAVKINISLTNLEHFGAVNEVMASFLRSTSGQSMRSWPAFCRNPTRPGPAYRSPPCPGVWT
jgi:reactive intermediate/imine deaminase